MIHAHYLAQVEHHARVVVVRGEGGGGGGRGGRHRRRLDGRRRGDGGAGRAGAVAGRELLALFLRAARLAVVAVVVRRRAGAQPLAARPGRATRAAPLAVAAPSHVRTAKQTRHPLLSTSRHHSNQRKNDRSNSQLTLQNFTQTWTVLSNAIYGPLQTKSLDGVAKT